ncbi:hypothetical protein F4604DRAFT_1676924 [Suillus subluteus]|nr:hypothetical protein F4604DRAFT_1676924 [Suillus subluteus]
MKNVWKEAKVIMCRKVLYGNAMCIMERNVELAEEAFLEATRRSQSCQVLKETNYNRDNCARGLQKGGSDAGSLSNHREAVVPPLLVNQTYLFEGIYKPVQFSPSSSSATEYRAIQTHNAIVRNTPALHSAALSIKQDMIARETSLRAH